MNEKLEKEIESYFANVPIKDLRDISNVARDFYEKGREHTLLDIERQVDSWYKAHCNNDEHFSLAFRQVLDFIQSLKEEI